VTLGRGSADRGLAQDTARDVDTRYRPGVGDDACWLDRTCLSCGRFLDTDEVDGERCPHCGAERVVTRAEDASREP